MKAVLPSLPAGWSETRLDRVTSVNARIGWKALTASEYQPDGFAFLSTPNIKGDKIDFENVNFISEFRYRESPELQLRVGDVLLVKDGNTLGITNLVRRLPRPATVNGSIAVLRTTLMHPPFLRYALESSPLRGLIGAYRAGMGVPHLFQVDIKKFPLPQPPMSVQHALADFLDKQTARIDSLIEKKRAIACLLDERLRVMAVHLMKAEDSDARATPLRRVITTIKTGSTPSSSDESAFTDDGVPWLGPSSVGERLEIGPPVKHLSDAVVTGGTAPIFSPDSTILVGIGATAGRVAHLELPSTEINNSRQLLLATGCSRGFSPGSCGHSNASFALRLLTRLFRSSTTSSLRASRCMCLRRSDKER